MQVVVLDIIRLLVSASMISGLVDFWIGTLRARQFAVRNSHGANRDTTPPFALHLPLSPMSLWFFFSLRGLVAGFHLYRLFVLLVRLRTPLTQKRRQIRLPRLSWISARLGPPKR